MHCSGGVPGSWGGCAWSGVRGVDLVVGGISGSWGVYLVLGSCTWPQGGCTWFWRVYLVWGVYLVLGGVPSPRGVSGLGGVPGPWGGCTWFREVYLVPGGMYLVPGVYLVPGGGVPGSRGGTCPGTPPLPRGQTDTCKNITFANFVCRR